MRRAFHAACAVCAQCLAAMAMASAVAAGTITLDTVYSGAVPGGDAPWIGIETSDAGPDRVLMTITALDLSGAEFLSRLAFNFNPAKDLSALAVSLAGGVAYATFAKSLDSVHAGPVHVYDIGLSFNTSKKKGRFAAGSFTSLLFTAPGLDEGDFLFAAPYKEGLTLAAAHVQGIAGCPEGSAWVGAEPGPVPAPEPGTLLLLAAGGLVALAGGRPARKG